jgi:hypothetical protein
VKCEKGVLAILRCRRCHRAQPIRRVKGRRRPAGHVKTMWCPWCKGVREHEEGKA